MDYLVFQLRAPLMAWGETAVGEYRPSAGYPGVSALLGLLAAALGLDRGAEAAQQALADGYGFAVGVQSSGLLLRDYHTAQVPGRAALKHRPQSTRRDELALPRDDLNTILSTRDYRQNAACLVAVQAGAAAPLWPRIVVADCGLAAMDQYRDDLNTLAGPAACARLERVAWGEGIAMRCAHDVLVQRKDRLLSRGRWQFGDRDEYIAFPGEG